MRRMTYRSRYVVFKVGRQWVKVPRKALGVGCIIAAIEILASLL